MKRAVTFLGEMAGVELCNTLGASHCLLSLSVAVVVPELFGAGFFRAG
jgi:hypothetical protein